MCVSGSSAATAGACAVHRMQQRCDRFFLPDCVGGTVEAARRTAGETTTFRQKKRPAPPSLHSTFRRRRVCLLKLSQIGRLSPAPAKSGDSEHRPVEGHRHAPSSLVATRRHLRQDADDRPGRPLSGVGSSRRWQPRDPGPGERVGAERKRSQSNVLVECMLLLSAVRSTLLPKTLTPRLSPQLLSRGHPLPHREVKHEIERADHRFLRSNTLYNTGSRRRERADARAALVVGDPRRWPPRRQRQPHQQDGHGCRRHDGRR